MSSALESGTSVNGWPVTGETVLRVAALDRGDPVAPDEVLVALLQLDGAACVPRSFVEHRLLDGCHTDSFLERTAPHCAATVSLADRQRGAIGVGTELPCAKTRIGRR